jgi:hypothetical protein
MIDWDYCWRFEHGARIANCKQRSKLFAGEHFGFDHDPSMTAFCNWSVVNFAQIDVAYWHISEVLFGLIDVRLWFRSGHRAPHFHRLRRATDRDFNRKRGETGHSEI